MDKTIVAYTDDESLVVKKNVRTGLYHVYSKGELVQPNHDAEGVIRYLVHRLDAVQRRLL